MAQLNIFRKLSVLMAVIAVDISALEPVLRVEIPALQQVEGLKVGGLSALHFGHERVFLLSDDRGKYGPSRFFEAQLQISEDSIRLSDWKAHPFQGIPSTQPDRKAVLDPEGLLRLKNGDFLVSSEADTNAKPRTQNRLLRISPKGVWQSELNLPPEIQPNLIGQQRQGTTNNAGPEGLSLSPSTNFIWMAQERPLIQEARDRVVRLDRFRKSGESYLPERSRAYQMDLPPEEGGELFRGVSSILALSDDEILVLERSALLDGVRISYGGAIYRAHCAEDPCRKHKIFDLSKDLRKLRGGKKVPNFEGLAWGPLLKDGSPSILLLSDNDFSEKTESELILLRVKDGL